MQITNTSNPLISLQLAKNGNESPVEFKINGHALTEKPGSLSPSTVTPIKSKSSSLEELEVYFEEKIALRQKSGYDTSSIIELRDSVRSATENSNTNSPTLPTVFEHPITGEKKLVNIDLQFTTELNAEPEDLSQEIALLNLPSLTDIKLK